MPRMRFIKPGFFTNDALGSIEPAARLLFIGLWCVADREGRVEDRPVKLKAELLPYDNVKVPSLLNKLVRQRLILRYKAEGTSYIQILNWEKHQHPHPHEIASEIPAPNGYKSADASPSRNMSRQRRDKVVRCPSVTVTGTVTGTNRKASDGSAKATPPPPPAAISEEELDRRIAAAEDPDGRYARLRKQAEEKAAQEKAGAKSRG